MESVAAQLAVDLLAQLENTLNSQRFLVGLAGIPASGKTSLAHLLCKHINKQTHPMVSAIVIGLDGWHLTRSQLSAMPEPKEAFARRGIHWTFDPKSYHAFLQQIRLQSSDQVTAPSFDHSIKDPTPDAIQVLPNHRIVIIEGLYVFLNIPKWCDAANLLDQRWLLDVNIEEARERLIRRHVVTGVASDEDEAIRRADQNDMPSIIKLAWIDFPFTLPLVFSDGRFLLENSLEPTRRIQSIQDNALSL